MAERRSSWLDQLATLDPATCGVEHDVLLAPMTTFRIGGPAEVLVTPRTAEGVEAVWHIAHAHGVPLTILGGGTNVLISDAGIEGIVLELGPGFGDIVEEPCVDGSATWRVGAGCGTGRLVRRAIVRGLGGPEVLAGVPGSVGGAIIMNAGGHTGEIQSMIRRVQAVVDGSTRWLSHDECGFSYRRSNFPAGSIVLAAELQMRAGDSEALRQVVLEAQRRRRATQPLDKPNAGSIFKNPTGDFAGRLLEAAGCKGWNEGGAVLSEKHANFIVNTGGATATEVARLARRVRDAVHQQFGVRLELEVKLLGEFAAEDRP